MQKARNWGFDALFFCAIGIALLMMGIRRRDVIDIIMGMLVIAFAAGIVFRGTWWAAGLLLAVSILGTTHDGYRLASEHFSWLTLIQFGGMLCALFVATVWLLAIWRQHRGLPAWWPFRR